MFSYIQTKSGALVISAITEDDQKKLKDIAALLYFLKFVSIPGSKVSTTEESIAHWKRHLERMERGEIAMDEKFAARLKKSLERFEHYRAKSQEQSS